MNGHLKHVLRTSYIGPFAVAYLLALGLRTLINAIRYPGAEIVTRAVNFILIRAHSEIFPAGETPFWPALITLPDLLVHAAIVFGAAAVLARWLYRPIDPGVPRTQQ